MISTTYQGTTVDKVAARIDVIHGLAVEILGRDDDFNHFLEHLGTQLFQRDANRVLGRDDHRVDALGHGGASDKLILDRDLIDTLLAPSADGGDTTPLT